ncbi:MAG: hypothetical protein CL942_15520 [Desulfovibrio sp.]|nr:hypothetical protein [Desulfovibrio sp.]|tara:strand:+ start:16370 stop:18469 length:2100 start_codon:yes stop_codon:yes gene_type:complete
MKIYTHLQTTCFAVIAASLIAAPSIGLAAPKKTYEEWLRQYGAWDQLDKEFARESTGDSPETLLKRANVYLNLNSPKQALEILEMSSAFEDNSQEAQRLWLGGQAHRAMGNLTKAVLWFTQSAEQLNEPKSIKRAFKDEDDLEYIWMDVWKKLYWAYGDKYSISQEVQQAALKRIANVGAQVWDTEYWKQARELMGLTTSEKNQPAKSNDSNPEPIMLSEVDKELIVKSFSLISLEKFDAAQAEINKIEHQAVRFFWTTLITSIETGQMPNDLSPLEDGNYLKANAFWQGNFASVVSQGKSAWVLGNPDSAPWTRFRNNLLGMPAGEAIVAIDKELDSMLISKEYSSLLKSVKLALSLSNGNLSLASSTWESVNKNELPLSLLFAGTLSFNKDFNNALPDSITSNDQLRSVFTTLAESTGHASLKSEAPFWVVSPDEKLQTLSEKTYPMDKLLQLAYWKTRFQENPTLAHAKRAAYLFDNTSFGTQATLYLADQAVEIKDLQLAAFYLNRIDQQTLSENQKMEWYDVKIKIELESGHNEKALRTYNLMTDLQAEIPVMTVLRMSLLFQQLRKYEVAREQLLSLWNKRDTLPSSLQAETLFWLGEGEQGLRNAEKALDYYLLLAWQYPQENIWALTAMYRASLIYEKRGKYETAKRLLTTVVKRADRKEQREAAKARINAIDNKMGKSSKNEASTLKYPF